MKKPVQNEEGVSKDEEMRTELRALEDLEDPEDFLLKNPEITQRLKGLFRIVEDGRG